MLEPNKLPKLLPHGHQLPDAHQMRSQQTNGLAITAMNSEDIITMVLLDLIFSQKLKMFNYTTDQQSNAKNQSLETQLHVILMISLI